MRNTDDPVGETGFTNANKEKLTAVNYFSKAIQICLSMNIPEKLGLSLKDLLNMDIWTFNSIEAALKEFKPVEQNVLNELTKTHSR